MTDDLVTRLRREADAMTVSGMSGYSTLIRESADEIERLQKLVSNHAWQENEQCKRAERAEAECDGLQIAFNKAFERGKSIAAERDALRALADSNGNAGPIIERLLRERNALRALLTEAQTCVRWMADEDQPELIVLRDKIDTALAKGEGK